MITLTEAIVEFKCRANYHLERAFGYEEICRMYDKKHHMVREKELFLQIAKSNKEEAEKCIQIAKWLKELVRLRGDEEK